MVTPSQTTAGADEREHVSNESSAPTLNAGAGWRLRLVVFVSGAVLMGLEMTGSRVLAAHFGSSIYVWGAIIGVFLAALSAGYYSGGLLADLKPTFPLLGGLLLVAGVWLLVIPLYANWLCRAVLSLSPGERMGPLVSTLLLFGGPSVLMGMVSPFAVRLAARSVESMGNVSGRLYALSTFGSIAGTLLTAFWLIPALGARTLLQVLGLCLVALPLLTFPASRSRLMLAAAFVLITPWLFVLNSGASVPTRAGQSVVYEADSAYHHVVVVDDPAQDARFLQFNNYIESGIALNPPHGTRVSYPDSFHLARVFKPELKNILIIGGGGGVGARKFVADDPRVSVDLVEIDPLVAEVGFKYFYLEPSERLRVHVEDGRSFVRRAALKYDLVVLDAFTIGGQIPFHLTTQEFMREVKNILAPGGVFLANINGSDARAPQPHPALGVQDARHGLREPLRVPAPDRLGAQAGRARAAPGGAAQHHPRRLERAGPLDARVRGERGRAAGAGRRGAHPDLRRGRATVHGRAAARRGRARAHGRLCAG